MSKLSNKSVQQPFQRIQLLDFIRGIAIGLMFIFHISFGLSEIGLLDINLSQDPLWVIFRAVIVFLFLSLVGIGLVLSNSRKQLENSSRKFYSNRLFQLFCYMMLITLFSYYVRPNQFVYFGILHLIFIASILGRWLTQSSKMLLILISLAFILLNLFIDSSYLNNPLVYWLGLGDEAPISDDFAPLFPWFSLVTIGIIFGQILFGDKQIERKLAQWKAGNWITRLICWGGKHSIHIYFIHFQFFYLLVLVFS